MKLWMATATQHTTLKNRKPHPVEKGDIMSTLMNAVLENETVTTENGMAALATSGVALLDLFGKVGSGRKADLSQEFYRALSEDANLAARILMWARDARGGAGERETFRKLFSLLVNENPDLARKVLAKVPELGRWDDVLVALGTTLETDAVEMIRAALESGNGLCAKWMPRKGEVAAKLRSRLGWSPKFYRKRLVELSTVVETQMCAKEWDKIVFEHVPSVAMTRYNKAFRRNASGKFATYMASVEKGEAKMNMSVAFPHDVVRAMKTGSAKDADVMWSKLPDYLEGTGERFIPVVDVSGSMMTPISGSVHAIDVSVGLGIYCAQRNNSVFKNEVIMFSETPSFVKIGSKLSDAYKTVMRGDWGMSTNLEAVFDMILKAAVKGRVAPEDMPTKILIMSDMQFNQCIEAPDKRAYSMIKGMYEDAGYKMPTVVFWNLCGRETTMPIKHNDENTAIVSGFSPSILKSLMKGTLNPMTTMLDTIMVERYVI